MGMRSLRPREFSRQAALQSQRRELGREFHHQNGVGETSQGYCAVDSPCHEQKGQPRRKPQQKPENIDAPSLGKCGYFVLFRSEEHTSELQSLTLISSAG